MKTKCKCCGDTYTETEEAQEKICDECFQMREDSQNMPDDCFSDADPGL